MRRLTAPAFALKSTSRRTLPPLDRTIVAWTSAAAESVKLSVVDRRVRDGDAFRALTDGATGAAAPLPGSLGSGLTVIVPFMNECTRHAYVKVPALSKVT